MAEAVGIAAPAAVSIELSNGRSVFGSRRIAGVADAIVTEAFLTTPTASNVNPPIFGLSGLLSKIYALDMFLFNDDRHLGNYLSVDDQGVRRLYTYDFSRALFWTWPWNGFPLPQCNTRKFGGVLRSLHGFDHTAAFSVLDGLNSLEPVMLQMFIKQMPSDWANAQICNQFVEMWANGTAALRVDELRKGFGDGTLL